MPWMRFQRLDGLLDHLIIGVRAHVSIWYRT